MGVVPGTRAQQEQIIDGILFTPSRSGRVIHFTLTTAIRPRRGHQCQLCGDWKTILFNTFVKVVQTIPVKYSCVTCQEDKVPWILVGICLPTNSVFICVHILDVGS